jgi:hypothetical protein
MANYAIVVTGDRRAIADVWEPVLSATFRDLRGHAEHVVLIHGDCAGIDKLAEHLASVHLPGVAIVPMPYVAGAGKAGGPMRNRSMITVALALRSVGYVARCLAFHDNLPGSKGTKNCVGQALAADIKTILRTSTGAKTVMVP